MGINAEKIELAKKVLSIDDANTLQSVKALLNGVDNDWWIELDDEARASIERGLEQSDKGELYNNEDIFKSIP